MKYSLSPIFLAKANPLRRGDPAHSHPRESEPRRLRMPDPGRFPLQLEIQSNMSIQGMFPPMSSSGRDHAVPRVWIGKAPPSELQKLYDPATRQYIKNTGQ
jgi:hypothetical protein